MVAEETINQSPTVVDRFFQDIRLVGLGDIDRVSLSSDELYSIFDDISLSLEFKRKFDTFSQDPELKLMVIGLIQQLAKSEKSHVVECEDNVLSIDRYGRPISSGAIVGGVGAVIYGAAAAGTIAVIGPGVLAVSGLAGFVACVTNRNRINADKRLSMERQEVFEHMAAQLAEKIDEDGGQG